MRSAPKVTYLKDYKVSDFLIDHVDLRFELDETKTVVKSKLHVRVNPAAEKKSTQLNLHGEKLELMTVMINGQALDAAKYTVTPEGLEIRDVPEQCEIEIHNTINPAANTALRGLYVSNQTFATHNEAQGFRFITYYLDRPDVMATYTTTIVADPAKCPVMLSNGNFKEESVLPDGRRLICWDDPIKKPSYLFALVAGDLAYLQDYFVTQSGRMVDLKIYAKQHQIERCRHAMQSLKKAMRWDEETYGRECDLDSYKVVAIDDFNIGAMENKGLNIFNTIALLATPATATDERHARIQGTVGHEYFHNWRGDRVTVRDWFQISGKEGLTASTDQAYSEAMFSKAARVTAVRNLRSRQFPEDAGPLAHPVQPESYITPDNFYTATIYLKGAEIHHMLRTLLGQQVYRRAMDLYFQRYDGQAVIIEQYIKVLEEASGLDLSQFMLWYHQAGTPKVTVEEEYLQDENAYILRFKQTCSPTPGQPEKKPLPIPIKMGLLDANGKRVPIFLNGAKKPQEEALLMLVDAEQTFRFDDVNARPLPSLLRDFSAPVDLQFEYKDAELQLLMEHDTDPFNRIEAAQRFVMNHLRKLIAAAEKNEPLVLPAEVIDTFTQLLLQDTDDKWMLAEMLTIPDEIYIADQLNNINVEAILRARECMVKGLAVQLKDVWMEGYIHCGAIEAPTTENSVHNPKEAANRRLKNTCLGFLLELGEADIQNQAFEAFERALKSNLTNTIAVFKNIHKLTATQRKAALEQFMNVWQKEPLVFLYWFGVQAAVADKIGDIKALLLHPLFDVRNPNTVSALIRGFCENMTCFHAVNGEGYRFLAETILQLDVINPKMSSSQVLYLSNWRKFDDVRKGHMTDALKYILQHDISKDLYELVSKCLGDALVLRHDEVPLKRIDTKFAMWKNASAVAKPELKSGMCLIL